MSDLTLSAGILARMTGWFAPVQRAARAFGGEQRLRYYELLADELEDTGGRTNILSIFLRDAQRYAGTPRGALSEHWAHVYEVSGASLSTTWSGTMPAEDVSLIAAAEKGGTAALISALRDLARVGEVIRRAKAEFYSTIASAIVGTAIAAAMLLALPYFFAPYFKQTFSFVPPHFYGPASRAYFAFADGVRSAWPYVLAVTLAGAAWVAWAMPNWTGRLRAAADERVLFFRLYRDFRGAIFLAMFASLTKSRAGAVTNQRNALVIMQEGAQPWLGWKIQSMLDRVDDSGALDATVFDVGIVDREIYYLMSDIIQARGISEGLERAGSRSEQRAVVTIAKRAKVLRWTFLFGALFVVVSLLMWQNVLFYEFKGAMSTYMNSR